MEIVLRGKKLCVECVDKRAIPLSMFLPNAKERLKKFAASGKTVNDLKSGEPFYEFVSGKRVFDEQTGEKLSTEEKFAAIGIERPSKKENVFLKGKRLLDAFVDAGGNVDDLTTKDAEYLYIKDNKFVLNGKLLNVEQTFAHLGHPRKAKKRSDVKEALIEEVDAYCKAGGSFHVERKTFPFYERVRTYINTLPERISFEAAMKGLGFKQFSDAYFRFLGLQDLKNYRDENGFVDAYRKDNKMRTYVYSAAEALDLPVALVVTLLCDEKLKECFVTLNYFGYVKAQLEKFAEENGSLVGLEYKNPSLYEKVRHTVKYVSDGAGTGTSKLDVIKIFGLEKYAHNLSDAKTGMKNVSFKMGNLIELAKANDGKLRKNDMSEADYVAICKNAAKLGINTDEYFAMYGIDYVDARKNPRMSKVLVKEFPFLKEMKHKRDELIAASGISAENGNCEEEIFENKLSCALEAYSQFKDKIVDASFERLSESVEPEKESGN